MSYPAAENYRPSDTRTPYVPVDPFRPSVEFSLNNVLPQHARRSRVAPTSSLHHPPQQTRFHGPLDQRTRYAYGPYPPIRSAPYSGQYSYPIANPGQPSESYPRWARGRSPTRRVGEVRSRVHDEQYAAPVAGFRRPRVSPDRTTGSFRPVPTHPIPREASIPFVRTRTPSLASPSASVRTSSTSGAVPADATTSARSPEDPATSMPSPIAGPSDSSFESREDCPTPVIQPPLQDVQQPITLRPPSPTLTVINLPRPTAAERRTPVPIILGEETKSSRSRSRSPRRRLPSIAEKPAVIVMGRERSLSPQRRSRSPRPHHRVGPWRQETISPRARSPLRRKRSSTPSSGSYYPTRRFYSASPRRPPIVVQMPNDAAVVQHTNEKRTADESHIPAMFADGNIAECEADLDIPPPSTKAYIAAFVLDTIPRQIYLHLLLRLPYLYFSRVTRIFEEAEMSMPMIRQGMLEAARVKAEAGYYDIGMTMPPPAVGVVSAGPNAWYQDNKSVHGNGHGVAVMPSQPYIPTWAYWEPPLENAAYLRLQNTWETFIDSLQREWKTLNIISVLLLSAILTILQIPTAAADPLTRYCALLSMVCALMSVLYGCIYIIRFSSMRKTYKGAEWAQEAQRSSIGIFWNVWVLLAMPATWLAWSMILYIVTIMSFVWRTSPISQPNMVAESSAQILIPRIIISLVVAVGVIYFILIAATLRRYGEMMDRAWQQRIWGWMRDGFSVAVGNGDAYTVPEYTSNAFPGREQERYERASDRASRPRESEAHEEHSNNSSRIRFNPSTVDLRYGVVPQDQPDVGFTVDINDVKEQSPLRPLPVESVPLHVESVDPEPTLSSIVVDITSRDREMVESASSPELLHRLFAARTQPTTSNATIKKGLQGQSVDDSGGARRSEPDNTHEHKEAKHAVVMTKSDPYGNPRPSTSNRNNAVFSAAPSPSVLNIDPGPSKRGLFKSEGDQTDKREVDSDRMAKAVKLFPLSPTAASIDAMSEQDLLECGIDLKALEPGELGKFKKELEFAFSKIIPSDDMKVLTSATPILEKFNQNLSSHGVEGQVALCKEFGQYSLFGSAAEYSAYFFSSFNPFSSQDVSLMQDKTLQRYGTIADGLRKLEILILDSRILMKTISLLPVQPGAQALMISTG